MKREQRNMDASGNDNSNRSKDIKPVLQGWDFEPDSINVRKIRGLDGALFNTADPVSR